MEKLTGKTSGDLPIKEVLDCVKISGDKITINAQRGVVYNGEFVNATGIKKVVQDWHNVAVEVQALLDAQEALFIAIDLWASAPAEEAIE